jgi:hypothetical protein
MREPLKAANAIANAIPPSWGRLKAADQLLVSFNCRNEVARAQKC